MSRIKIKKSVWLPSVLFVYVTAMAVYYAPRNHEISSLELWITIGVSYLIVFLLWLTLRKKEQLAKRREQDFNNKKGISK